MTTAQVVETSVTVNNSPIQDYVHADDQTQPTFEILLFPLFFYIYYNVRLRFHTLLLGRIVEKFWAQSCV